MKRAILIAAFAALGGMVGLGCRVFCADCNCGSGKTDSGPYRLEGTITEADRAELVGGTVTVEDYGVLIAYTTTAGGSASASYDAAP